MSERGDKPAELDHETSVDGGTDSGASGSDEVESTHEIGIELADEDEVVPPRPEPVPVSQFLTFEEAELHPKLLEAIKNIGWTAPTPVQALCLPHTLRGREVAGFAQTGTGKTGVFLITVSDRLLKNPELRNASGDNQIAYPASLVLVPTRELAMQIHSDGEGFLGGLGIGSLAVFGGVDYEKQARTLQEGKVDVIIATPGRLKDFVQKKIVSLSKCSLFVCDEVDRMFDMGFIEDVEYFLERISDTTQKLLFSATTNPEVKELAFEYLNHPEYISVNPETITPDTIEQHAVIVDAKNKLKVMLGMLRDHNPECSIIFTNTKLTADWLQSKLSGNGIDCDLITGDLPQSKRINLIQRIKQGKVRALIATDVASRGLHISRVSHVYNFDLPDEPANYVHRIGRTARAGAKGSSYALVCEDYGHNLAEINQLLGESLALKAEWFPESYLAIEDKAGNPYAAALKLRDDQSRGRDSSRSPNFGGSSDGRGGRPTRPSPDRGGGAHEGRLDSGRSGRPSYKDQERSGPGASSPRRDGREERPKGDRSPARVQHQTTQGGKRPQPKVQGPKGGYWSKGAKPPTLPTLRSSSAMATVTDMFKRIFSLFFKRK